MPLCWSLDMETRVVWQSISSSLVSWDSIQLSFSEWYKLLVAQSNSVCKWKQPRCVNHHIVPLTLTTWANAKQLELSGKIFISHSIEILEISSFEHFKHDLKSWNFIWVQAYIMSCRFAEQSRKVENFSSPLWSFSLISGSRETWIICSQPWVHGESIN